MSESRATAAEATQSAEAATSRSDASSEHPTHHDATCSNAEGAGLAPAPLAGTVQEVTTSENDIPNVAGRQMAAISDALQEPLLTSSVASPQDEMVPEFQFSNIHFVVWFIFAPIPINSLAASIDIRALTSSCCVRLPDYLSIRSKAFMYCVALLTHLSILTWLGLCAASVLVYRALQTAYFKTLHHFGFLLFLAHSVMVTRGACRLMIRSDLRKRGGLGVGAAARVEYYVDLIMWSSFMIGGTVKGHVWLQKERLFKQMEACELSESDIFMIKLLVRAFLDGWLVDVILRFLWLCLSVNIEGDFKGSLTYRLVSTLPTICNNSLCSICLDDISEAAGAEEAEAGCQMPCGHACHRSCLVAWARACRQESENSFSCPMCRFEIRFAVDDFGSTSVVSEGA